MSQWFVNSLVTIRLMTWLAICLQSRTWEVHDNDTVKCCCQGGEGMHERKPPAHLADVCHVPPGSGYHSVYEHHDAPLVYQTLWKDNDGCCIFPLRILLNEAVRRSQTCPRRCQPASLLCYLFHPIILTLCTHLHSVGEEPFQILFFFFFASLIKVSSELPFLVWHPGD